MADKKEYKRICPEDKCTGCMACLSACRTDSIIVSKDVCGFKYPLINQTTCVDCGLCYNVCPGNKPLVKVFPIKSYAFVVKDEARLERVASGGAAYFISKQVLKAGGRVYGCSGEDITHVRHVYIDSVEELHKFCGSKYVQSDMNLVGRLVLNDLKSGREVLFIGTPCQVAGIKNFVRKDWPNLLTMDLVCHGVPSQQMLNENIESYKERFNDINLQSIQFRKKTSENQIFKIEYGFGFNTHGSDRIFIPWSKDPYMSAFLCSSNFRSCCYQCDYAYSSRISDLTVSDYWGLPKKQGFINGKGVSNILVNTAKGQEIVDLISDSQEIKIERRTIREAIAGNAHLMCPTARNGFVDKFRTLYPQLGLKKAVDKTLSKYIFKLKIKSMARKIVKRIIR